MKSKDYQYLLDQLKKAEEGKQYYKNLRPFLKSEVNKHIKMYELDIEELRQQLKDVKTKKCYSCEGTGKTYWLFECKDCEGAGIIYYSENIEWLKKQGRV
jgi:RecJ-like exonuclease